MIRLLAVLSPFLAAIGCVNVSAAHAEACGPWAVSEACRISGQEVSPPEASRDILDHASLLQSAGRGVLSPKITWPGEIPLALKRHGLRGCALRTRTPGCGPGSPAHTGPASCCCRPASIRGPGTGRPWAGTNPWWTGGRRLRST